MLQKYNKRMKFEGKGKKSELSLLVLLICTPKNFRIFR